MITGASSGIGEEFAHQLAQSGFNLVLVAQNQIRLKQIAEKLITKHQIEIEVIPVDLTVDTSFDKIIEATKELEIGLLINNAGTGHPGSFLKNHFNEEKKVVRLNCTAPMELAHHYGNKMVSKSRGGIIFISSAMGYQGTPFMANYSASKSYSLTLGEALHHELKEHGVDVLVVSPGATDTPGTKLYDIDYSALPIKWMQAKEVVSKSMSNLGKTASFIPGARNKLFTCVSSGLFTRSCIAPLFVRLAKKVIPRDRI